MGKPIKVCPIPLCKRIYFAKNWVKATQHYFDLLTKEGFKYELCKQHKLMKVRVKALSRKLK